jgi:hypothetical protein
MFVDSLKGLDRCPKQSFIVGETMFCPSSELKLLKGYENCIWCLILYKFLAAAQPYNNSHLNITTRRISKQSNCCV